MCKAIVARYIPIIPLASTVLIVLILYVIWLSPF